MSDQHHHPPLSDQSFEFTPFDLRIYKLEKSTLTLCYTMPGNPRPATFESPPKSGIYLVVWKRDE